MIETRKAKTGEAKACGQFAKNALSKYVYVNVKNYPKKAIKYDVLCRNENAMSRMIKDENSFVFIAKEKKIIGLISGSILGQTSGVCHILLLSVDPQYQKRGIGKKLFEKVEKWAKKKKCHKLYVTTLLEIGAVPFYQKRGMKIASKLNNFMWHQNFVYLEKKL